jgi:hypothetical protein
LLSALPLLGGCYGFVSGVGSGIDQAAFDLTRVVLGAFGLIGVAMTIVGARHSVRHLTLSLYWLIGLSVIGVTAWSTNFFNPWPGAFRQRAIWFLWLPLPLALAPFVATGRFALARTSSRAGRPIAIAAVVSGLAYVGALAHTSHAVLPIPFTQTITELVVTDSWSFGRTESGGIVALNPTRELAGSFRAMAGGAGALAIDSDGNVVILSPHEPPQRLAVTAPARSIAVGPKFQCAADAAGQLVCFDAFAPASDGERLGFGPTPLKLEGFDSVVEVAVSDALICARSQDGKVRCTSGDPSQRVVSEITSAPGQPHRLWDGVATTVAVTRSSACIVDTSGSVHCAGENEWGELGPARGSSRPVAIAGLGDVRQLVAGTFHLCALRQDGAVLCWGGNGWGQLGGTAASPDKRPSPQQVPLPGRATALFRHATSTCARLEDKALFCWGAQRRPGNLVAGDVCDKPFFAAPMVCSSAPARVEQPATFVPVRPSG